MPVMLRADAHTHTYVNEVGVDMVRKFRNGSKVNAPNVDKQLQWLTQTRGAARLSNVRAVVCE